jgi:ribosomal-protein-alanine N-acetyltransferase
MAECPARVPMNTGRLVLRPTIEADAERAFDIQSDWEVGRMLRMASFPPDRAELRQWFADHCREWQAGEAYRFAVDFGGKMIGIVDVDEIADRKGSLGYWLDRACWGRGYAFESAQCVAEFAFREVGLSELTAGHVHDNPASGRILTKLGFLPVRTARLFSRSRGEEIR